MSQLLFLIIIMIMGAMFMTMNHPLAMGLMLLFQTLIVSVYTGLISLNFWFSYILFLVFLGGMLVLFIYVTSLASNELFSISSKTIIHISILTILMMSFILFCDPVLFSNINLNNNTLPMNLEISQLTLLLIKMYNSFSSLITMILISYLFLTLLVIVNITDIHKGPLRPLTN